MPTFDVFDGLVTIHVFYLLGVDDDLSLSRETRLSVSHAADCILSEALVQNNSSSSASISLFNAV